MSHDYYNKILNESPTAQDYLNIGHLVFCERHYEDAINYYMQSLKLFDYNMENFMHNFTGDKNYLLQRGLTELEICLIADKLAYNCQKP